MRLSLERDSAMAGQQNDKVEWNCQLKFVFNFFIPFFFLSQILYFLRFNLTSLVKQDSSFRPLVAFLSYKNGKNDKKDIPCLGLLYKMIHFLRNDQKPLNMKH